MDTKKYAYTVGGAELSVEITDWAEQAHGSVLVRMGDTVVLVTAVMNPVPREGGDFFPLTVEYEEKYYAAGKVLGSRFIKRETRPSEEAILAARLIDRAIRPRFDMRMRNEVQIVATTLSLDEKNDPDILAMLGASLALSLSNIPWNGPIAGVRIAQKNGASVLNPSFEERLNAELDLVIAGTRERINMCEAGAREIDEEAFVAAAELGHEAIKDMITFQDTVISAHARPKRDVRLLSGPEELKNLLVREFSRRIEEAVYQKGEPRPRPEGQGIGAGFFGKESAPADSKHHLASFISGPEGPEMKEANSDKAAMHVSIHDVKMEWLAAASRQYPDAFQKNAAEFLFEKEIDALVHRRIIEKAERPDGRKPDEIRALSAQVAVLPRVHGSGLFMRGSTHILSTLTLGAPGDQQIVEGMEIRAKRHFLHHYNFPPFSVGEVRPMRGPGRREIGHGALAARALAPLLPPQTEFPYTIRIVSEVLSSNGSSSMGSVSAASLALMDGGVPIKKLVSGAAMGLMLAQQPTADSRQPTYRILTDIQGPEDHHGDMDFKVAGTRDGITAVQMDVKIEGVTLEMIRETLQEARSARMRILDVMEQAISEPRRELSPWAPRIVTLKINPEKIGALIGPGGKIINDIIARTGVAIDIEDDGTVFVTSEKEEGIAVALEEIKLITRELKPGDIVEGKVTRLLDFGAFVEVGPRQDGLIHISELAPWHVERVTDILNLGDTTKAVVKNIDEQGRINLSLKDVPGRYSEEEIARGRAQQNDMPRPHRRPPGGTRFSRPRGR